MNQHRYRNQVSIWDYVRIDKGAAGEDIVPKERRKVRCSMAVASRRSDPQLEQVSHNEVIYDVRFKIDPKLEVGETYIVWRRQRYDVITPVVFKENNGDYYQCYVKKPTGHDN